MLTRLADKVLAKAFVAARIGGQWVIPTLWQGSRLPRAPQWPLPFVLKARHGCNQCAFLRTGDEDWPAIRRRAERWVRSRYGSWLDEWGYRDIERGLLVEPFVGTGGVLPVDYKFFVFGGRVEFVQVHVNRETEHRRVIFNRNWRRVSILPDTVAAELPRPHTLDMMMEAAEELGRDSDFVRVDLYNADPHPLFGEFTFYPGSGLDPFEPVGLDQAFGERWLKARALRSTW